MSRTQRVRVLSRLLFRLCVASGVLDADVLRKLVQRTIASRSRDRFTVLKRLMRSVKVYQARHTALVESFEPLPLEVRSGLQAGLTQLYGRGLYLAFKDSPDLIGGIYIRVGSDVYDGSVRGRLSALAARF